MTARMNSRPQSFTPYDGPSMPWIPATSRHTTNTTAFHILTLSHTVTPTPTASQQLVQVQLSKGDNWISINTLSSVSISVYLFIFILGKNTWLALCGLVGQWLFRVTLASFIKGVSQHMMTKRARLRMQTLVWGTKRLGREIEWETFRKTKAGIIKKYCGCTNLWD